MSDAATHTSTVADGRARGRRTAAARALAGGGRTLDIATIAGLAGGIAVIAGAIALGGTIGGFVDLPAMMIVFLGTAAVTAISFELSDLLRAGAVMGKSLINVSQAPARAALAVIGLAEACRRDGVLSLQSHLDEMPAGGFLARGLALVVDGAAAGEAEAAMRTDMHAIADRHDKGASILRRAAEVAPAMGLIGTLVGLVQMLGNIENPAAIGPAMAVALLTTFYGAVLGNMVFAPLAAKLERKSDDEALLNEIYLLGVVSIARQEHPLRLQTRLNTILPPAQRVAYLT